jgi:hypothetical protein
MKTLMLAVLGVGLAMSTAPSAHARDGCGLGFHRAFNGVCYPNHVYGGPGPVVVGVPGPVVVLHRAAPGFFYPGHGWWDGYHYWRHRAYCGGGWHYY